MASCNSGRVRSARPCRPSSSGGATLRRAMSETLCLHASGAASEAEPSPLLPRVPPPSEADFATLVLTAPMMPGAEYLDADTLLALWDEMGAAFAASLAGQVPIFRPFSRT